MEFHEGVVCAARDGGPGLGAGAGEALHHLADQLLACLVGQVVGAEADDAGAVELEAEVVALRGDIRADYAKALMKAQMGVQASPLACDWATHQLILRVSLLSRREPSLHRDNAGFLTMTFLAIMAMVIVWSVSPRGPDAGDLEEDR